MASSSGRVVAPLTRGGAQAPTAHASGHIAAIYQTSKVLLAGEVQPVAVARAKTRSVATIEEQKDASVLFDTRSTNSYVSSHFAPYLDVSRESLSISVFVSKLVRDFVIVDQVYLSSVVSLYVYDTRADLLLLDNIDFEVILGIDWLSPHHAILDCYSKIVTLVMLEWPRLEHRYSSSSASSWVISFLKSQHMVENGCLAYLDFVRDTAMETLVID
ncbi:uncharacterized protein [Nicotiana tomentosiformis]|uniref:uncharacterized protein n=1 Tax=Nicotiana tomentosiformis TaxID=4098 RepID=UPI00388C9627